MKIGAFEQKEIQRYFKIDWRIEQIKMDIRSLRESFYDQSMATYVTNGDIALISIGFNLETNVIPLVDTINCMEETIERLQKKKRYLNEYLDSLHPWEKEYVIQRYAGNQLPKTANPSDVDLYAEILEIEDAINFIYGYPQEIRMNADEIGSETLGGNIDAVAELLGV